MDPAEARDMILDFAKNHQDIPKIKFITDHAEQIKIREYGEGQVNFVFGITCEETNDSLILKHARDYAKFDKEEKMSIERQTLEFNALSLLEKLMPGSVPKPYCLDTNFNIIAMENLGHMDLLGTQLAEQRMDQEAIKKCGTTLAKLHKTTMKVNNNQEEWAAIENKFRHDDLRDVIKNIMFERSLLEDDPINLIPVQIKDVYRELIKAPETTALFSEVCKIHNEDVCFILGDCHCNGIFQKDGRCALFDMEFAYIGQPAANLAMVLVGFIYYPLSLPNPDWSLYITAARNFVEAYYGEIGDDANKELRVQNLTALTGATLFDVAIFCKTDEMVSIITAKAKIEMMKRGIKILKQYKTISDIDSFINVCFQHSEEAK